MIFVITIAFDYTMCFGTKLEFKQESNERFKITISPSRVGIVGTLSFEDFKGSITKDFPR
jgi:hypothetical protein